MQKKMLKFMSKPMTFQNQPFGPSKFKTHVGKGFSGQIIPEEARRGTSKDEKVEPKSPKVSCIGRIKHKNKKKPIEGPKTKASSLNCFFSKPQGKSSGVPRPQSKFPERVSTSPGLIQMRRFASGHNKLAGFDWMTHVAPVDMEHQSLYFPYEESDGENEAAIPFSAPTILGKVGLCGENDIDLKPRKEINLWKRRAMAQLRPLQVAPLRQLM